MGFDDRTFGEEKSEKVLFSAGYTYAPSWNYYASPRPWTGSSPPELTDASHEPNTPAPAPPPTPFERPTSMDHRYWTGRAATPAPTPVAPAPAPTATPAPAPVAQAAPAAPATGGPQVFLRSNRRPRPTPTPQYIPPIRPDPVWVLPPPPLSWMATPVWTPSTVGSGDAVAGVYGMVEVELLFRLLVSWESNFGLGEKEEEEIVGRDGADGGVWCLEGPANDN
ncbi:MAG: hypothetical protein NXY57DRAFT_958657 [Lentinula lateritia]|nr:MAG: hypothetical protein NXY57DRAFT_958657 [Lentinula lateritia]